MRCKKTSEHIDGKQPLKRRTACSEMLLTGMSDITSQVEQSQEKIKNRNREISPMSSKKCDSGSEKKDFDSNM